MAAWNSKADRTSSSVRVAIQFEMRCISATTYKDKLERPLRLTPERAFESLVALNLGFCGSNPALVPSGPLRRPPTVESEDGGRERASTSEGASSAARKTQRPKTERASVRDSRICRLSSPEARWVTASTTCSER